MCPRRLTARIDGSQPSDASSTLVEGANSKKEQVMRIRKCGLMGVSDDGTMWTPSGKKLFRLPLRLAAFVQRMQHWFASH